MSLFKPFQIAFIKDPFRGMNCLLNQKTIHTTVKENDSID